MADPPPRPGFRRIIHLGAMDNGGWWFLAYLSTLVFVYLLVRGRSLRWDVRSRIRAVRLPPPRICVLMGAIGMVVLDLILVLLVAILPEFYPSIMEKTNSMPVFLVVTLLSFCHLLFTFWVFCMDPDLFHRGWIWFYAPMYIISTAGGFATLRHVKVIREKINALNAGNPIPPPLDTLPVPDNLFVVVIVLSILTVCSMAIATGYILDAIPKEDLQRWRRGDAAPIAAGGDPREHGE